MVSFYMMSGRTHPYDVARHSDVERNIVNDNPDLSTVHDPLEVDFAQTKERISNHI